MNQLRPQFFSFLLLFLCALSGQAQQLSGKPGTFTVGNKEFMLNGKPFVIRAAELHYPLIPREY